MDTSAEAFTATFRRAIDSGLITRRSVIDKFHVTENVVNRWLYDDSVVPGHYLRTDILAWIDDLDYYGQARLSKAEGAELSADRSSDPKIWPWFLWYGLTLVLCYISYLLGRSFS